MRNPSSHVLEDPELRLPFAREHVVIHLAFAVFGILVASLTLGSGVARVPARGGPSIVYLALMVAPVLAVFVALASGALHRRSQSRLSWRETRRSALLPLVAVPLYAGFVFWIMRRETSPAFLTAATFFLWGLISFVSALPDRSRWYSLGWAAATMLAGFFAPLVSYERAGVLVGAWLLCGGLSTALTMVLQLRDRKPACRPST
jgi:hypothetical protein